MFEFFRDFDKPYFNICTQLDITRLLEPFVIALTSASCLLSLLRPPRRQRNRAISLSPEKGKVIVHDVIHGSTTVTLPDELHPCVF